MGFKRGVLVGLSVFALGVSGCGMFNNSSKSYELRGGLAARADEVLGKSISSPNPYVRFNVIPELMKIQDIGRALDVLDSLPDDTFASRKIDGYMKIQGFLDKNPKYLEEHVAVAEKIKSYESGNKLAKK